MKKIKLLTVLITALCIELVLIIGYLIIGNTWNKPGSQEYSDLLCMYLIDSQGNSLEATLKPNGPSEQPMTYGLVLSSEINHYNAIHNDESEIRIKKAVNWLLNNVDIDQDGIPGWGLPQVFDAFADGTVNPENYPYTITTATVIYSLLDALTLTDFWTENERENITDTIYDVTMYFLTNVYVGNSDKGYMGYSPDAMDMTYNTPNISSMFLSCLVRVISEQPDMLNKSDKEFVTEHINGIVNDLLDTIKLRNGVPYWNYIISEDETLAGYNDLIHHVFIVWGLEEYRLHYKNNNIPYTLADGIKSVDNFIKNNKIYGYPQDIVYTGDFESFNERPSNLWGTGMMLAFYTRFDTSKKADRCLALIKKDYGPFPSLTMWPSDYKNDKKFYARYAAYVLYGLSLRDFYGND